MKKLEDILATLPLPIALPVEVFYLFGKRRKIPDLEFIVNKRLPQLIEHLEKNGTATMGGKDVYLLPLIDEGMLSIKLEGQTIVEISYLQPPKTQPESISQLLTGLKQS